MRGGTIAGGGKKDRWGRTQPENVGSPEDRPGELVLGLLASRLGRDRWRSVSNLGRAALGDATH